MIREIVQLGDPVLRTKAESVELHELQTPEFRAFLADLAETMEAAGGVGIAAPQIGVSKRVFIVAAKPNARYPNAPLMPPTVMINPVLEWKSSELEKGWEGCLSIPGIRGNIPRSVQIRVRYTEPETATEISAEYRSFVARVFQHENDHLDGIVFLDRTSSYDIITENEYRKMLNIL